MSVKWEGEPRGALGLLLDRRFGALFWGKLLSYTGVWIHSTASAILVFSNTRSALWVGLITVAQFSPQLLFSLQAGKQADKGDLRRQLILGRLLACLGSGLIMAALMVTGPRSGIVVFVVLVGSATTGFGFVVGGPAQQAIIPLIIRRGELGVAMGLSTLPGTLSRVLGPVGGAWVLLQTGPAVPYAVAGCTHIAFIGLLLLGSLPSSSSKPDGIYSIGEGLKYVLGDRGLILALGVVTASGVAAEPSVTLAPSIVDVAGGGPELVGQLTTAFGGGAAAGFFVYSVLPGGRRSELSVISGLGLLAIGLWGTAMVPAGWALYMCICGVGFTLALTGGTTMVQTRAPQEMRGRIMALWFLGYTGSRPIAGAFQGVLVDVFSLSAALAVTGLGVATLLGICLWRWHDLSM